jgi:hypothetical protein
MTGPLYRFLADDHARLDLLLQGAFGHDEIDQVAYAHFRAVLLKHIAMEEKVLLPAAQRFNNGIPLPVAAKLRLDHGALAALLVPVPTRAIGDTLRVILKAHNPLEEGPCGLYDTCEQLAGPQVDRLVAELRAVPEVKLAPNLDGPNVVEAVRRALARAGYALQEE